MSRAGRVRRETPRLEDYLEAIFHLIHDKGYASTVEISEKLRVKPPTVSNMLQKLDAGGYLVREPYRGMRLTKKGEDVARSVVRRHGTIEELLYMLGVDRSVAYLDAEGAEHNLQPSTIERLGRLVKFLKNNPTVLDEIRNAIDSR